MIFPFCLCNFFLVSFQVFNQPWGPTKTGVPTIIIKPSSLGDDEDSPVLDTVHPSWLRHYKIRATGRTWMWCRRRGPEFFHPNSSGTSKTQLHKDSVTGLTNDFPYEGGGNPITLSTCAAKKMGCLLPLKEIETDEFFRSKPLE